MSADRPEGGQAEDLQEKRQAQPCDSSLIQDLFFDLGKRKIICCFRIPTFFCNFAKELADASLVRAPLGVFWTTLMLPLFCLYRNTSLSGISISVETKKSCSQEHGKTERVLPPIRTTLSQLQKKIEATIFCWHFFLGMSKM